LFILHFIPHGQVDVTGDQRMSFYTYSLPFTKMPPKKDVPRVILMGNSVWETTKVASCLLQFEKKSLRRFEIGNFSLSGTSWGDYLFVYNYIRKFHPDLIVVHVYPMTFAVEKPLFRHKAHYLIFTPEMKELRHPQILKAYSNDELLESLMYSYFPVYRSFLVGKHHLHLRVGELVEEWSGIPVMNILPDVILKKLPPLDEVESDMASAELEQSWQWLVFLIEQMERDQQKAVFILQETALEPLHIYERLDGLFADKKYVTLQDVRRFYKKDEFRDKVHPNDKEGSLKAAFRLMKIINEHLIQ